MYSKSYGKGGKSAWNDENSFDVMACKTVLKITLSRWGLLSTELELAIKSDQGIIDDQGIHYADNPQSKRFDAIDENKEFERIKNFIDNANTLDELAQVQGIVSQYNLAEEYEDKFNSLTK